MEPPTWTPWTHGTTELRYGLLLVARLTRRNASALECCIPAIGELPGNRGTIGTFFGRDALQDATIHLAALGLPTPPPEQQ